MLLPRITAGLSTAILVAGATAIISTGAASAGASTASLTTSATTGAPGMTVTLTGKVPTKNVARKVHLRRTTGGAWPTIATAKTAKNGTFSFTATLPQTSGTAVMFKVLAPRTVVGKKVLKRVSTSRTTVSVPCTDTATTPATTNTRGRLRSSAEVVSAGADVVLNGRVRGKVARKIRLQLKTSTRWATVTNGKTSKNGRFSFSTPAPALPGRTVAFRVVAPQGMYAGRARAKQVTRTTGVIIDRACQVSTTPTATPTSAPTTAPTTTPTSAPTSAPTTVQTTEPAASKGITAVTRGNWDSSEPSISDNGRWVAYWSDATDIPTMNLATDTNNLSDVFLHDRQTGETINVSGLATDGLSAKSTISGDGSRIAYVTWSKDMPGAAGMSGNGDLVVYDVATKTNYRLTDGIAVRNWPRISANGDVVVFSTKSALASEDINGTEDVYLADLSNLSAPVFTLLRTSTLDSLRGSMPVISADGKVIAFESKADLLGDQGTPGISNIYRYEIATQTLTRVTDGSTEDAHEPTIDGDGSAIAFSGLGSGWSHRHLRLWEAGVGIRTIAASDGWSWGPWISTDGTLVSFTSSATDLPGDSGDTGSNEDVFLWDSRTGQVELIARGNGYSLYALVSGDGSAVVFDSSASDIVNPANTSKTNIYVAQR